jgi:serine/threonine protein kinase
MSGQAPSQPRYVTEGEIRILGRIPCRPCRVEKVFDRELNRRVVVKGMRPPREPYMAGNTSPNSLRAEGAILAALAPHRNIPAVFEYDDQRIVMELIEGTNLLELICDSNFQVSPSQAASWLKQLISVVSYCHERGILHN